MIHTNWIITMSKTKKLKMMVIFLLIQDNNQVNIHQLIFKNTLETETIYHHNLQMPLMMKRKNNKMRKMNKIMMMM